MKQERLDRLNEQLKRKQNCCQAVLAAFCEDYGLSRETAELLAGGMGGGMSLGEKCGAVTAMFLIAGLEYGPFEGTDAAKKNELKQKVQRLNAKFNEAFGETNCKPLMIGFAQKKYDLPDQERYAKRPCILLMEKACDLLEEELGI